MKKAIVFLADGFEEIEALTTVDVLRRAGVKCDCVSVCKKTVTGAHGIKVETDCLVNDADFGNYDVMVLPGGMPGAKILGECARVIECAASYDAQHKIIAAICAAPAVVLGMNGLAAGRKVTCYPAPQFIQVLEDAEYTDEEICVDENLITASGPLAAMKFALQICSSLGVMPSF